MKLQIDYRTMLTRWRTFRGHEAALMDVRPPTFGLWSRDTGDDFTAEEVLDLELAPRGWNRIGGVYCIRFQPKAHAYVGASQDIRQRWRQHLLTLGNGTHLSPQMQALYRESGPCAFRFRVLEHVPQDGQLKRRELHWMKLLSPTLNPGKECLGLEGLRAPAEHG